MKNLIIAMALMIVMVGTAEADTLEFKAFHTGLDFLQKCEEKKAHIQTQCIGYIEAVVDTVGYLSFWWEKNTPICMPGEVFNLQLRLIVTRFFNENPKLLHLPAQFLVIQALNKAYPCSSTKILWGNLND